MDQFTRRQWLTLIVISIADFANAVCVSLQAPFYPQEVSLDIIHMHTWISSYELCNTRA